MIVCVLIVENYFKKMQLEKENNLQTQVTAIYGAHNGAYIGTIEHNWGKVWSNAQKHNRLRPNLRHGR